MGKVSLLKCFLDRTQLFDLGKRENIIKIVILDSKVVKLQIFKVVFLEAETNLKYVKTDLNFQETKLQSETFKVLVKSENEPKL